jgi:hypothetical protein
MAMGIVGGPFSHVRYFLPIASSAGEDRKTTAAADLAGVEQWPASWDQAFAQRRGIKEL